MSGLFLFLRPVKNYLSLIKFSHTIFALPFALIGFIIGWSVVGTFDLRILLLVLLCMVFARSAAMAFNRYVDRRIDARNPRTAEREIPAGIIPPKRALLFVAINAFGFLIAAGSINRLCLYLAPLALFIILFYSYSKRFTAFCHVILGVGLGLAPVGAYIAVTGAFSLPVVFLGVGVIFWVAGFDIIYALQDDDFDSSQNLHSIPVRIGRKRALLVSRTFHVFTGISLCAAAVLLADRHAWMSGLSAVGLAFFVASLVYQHFLVRPHDLSKVGRAFFTANGVASLVLGAAVIIDFFV